MRLRISVHQIVALVTTIAACAVIAVPACAKKEIVLYSFCQSSGCPDGQDPYSPMAQDAAGNLYGTTLYGGNSSNAGTIYELQKVGASWTFHSLYSFCSQTNCTDGSTPYGGVIIDTSGNLYGTTLSGGNANEGIVYELQAGGTLKVLYSFCAQANCADGSQPYAGLDYQGQQNGNLYDGKSTLYGTVSKGGTSNFGAVFAITPGVSESTVYNFGSNQNDGEQPMAPLIMDGSSNLYGTTEYGGLTAGTIFSVTPTGSETVLFSFGSLGEENGAHPGTGALLMNSDATLFGTAGGGPEADGVVYSFGADKYSMLASFCNRRACRTGAVSQSALIEDSSGTLYGVAPLGGKDAAIDKGTVFEFKSAKLKALYSFCAETNCTDGAEPYSSLLMNSRGQLFGTATQGGAFNGGAIFELP